MIELEKSILKKLMSHNSVAHVLVHLLKLYLKVHMTEMESQKQRLKTWAKIANKQEIHKHFGNHQIPIT